MELCSPNKLAAVLRALDAFDTRVLKTKVRAKAGVQARYKHLR